MTIQVMMICHSSSPLVAISRHRIYTDGEGVTTLVVFHGCPLSCPYCINPECKTEKGVWETMTPEKLLETVRIDNLYFLATHGGICFGGGEPLLRSRFINEFCEIAPPKWQISLETSLNVAPELLQDVAPHIHSFIIDIKDMNPEIYRNYTGHDNRYVLENLKWLISADRKNDVVIRLPLIPGYNTDSDRDNSERVLRKMGFDVFERFNYIKDIRQLK